MSSSFNTPPRPVAAVFWCWRGWEIDVDGTPILVGDRHVAARVAELLDRHGLVDIPDTIPDDVLWGPPGADERIIDWRLPEEP